MTPLARLAVILLIGLITASGPALAQSSEARTSSHFTDWSSAIVAADWRDGAGQPTDAFDNAVIDLSAAFERTGFSRAGMVSLSLRPDAIEPLTPQAAVQRIATLTATHTGGCLLYFTSHGSPESMVFGERQLPPAGLSMLTENWCGSRPTVVVISACFSGIFIDSLKAPNRLVLTASRRDRTSFGCGAGDRYPWFDACVLESLTDATDFLALAAATRACVARREVEGSIPPELSSMPQMFVGADMQLRLPTLRFQRPDG
jgi:Peptidase C13 family.